MGDGWDTPAAVCRVSVAGASMSGLCYFISVSLSGYRVDLLLIPSVSLCMCVSVCLSVRKVYCEKMTEWLDPDVVQGGEWGRSRDSCIRWGWWSSNRKQQFWGWIWGHPIVTNTLLHSCVRATRFSQITLGGLVIYIIITIITNRRGCKILQRILEKVRHALSKCIQ